jgi:hypothetical protein
MPDWDKINETKRLEIVKRQTANQLWNFVIEKAACEEAEFPEFKEVLKAYEEGFPKLLEINKKLFLGGEENEQEN